MVDDDLTRGMLSTLHPVLCALIAKRDATFEDLARFFDEKDNADLIELGMNNPNPSHKAEISRINEGQNNQTRNAMRRRINSFLSNHMFRDFVIGKTSFDLEELMNTGKIVIFHLPIGEQGGDTLKYIGKMIIAQVKYFGFRRIKIEESHRPHTCFIIDECQYFLSKSLVEAYTQLRRFKVFMHIATQSAENLETLKDKAITNSGIKTTGHVDSQETKNLIHRACGVSVEELTSLRMSELEFYVKSFSYPRGYRCKLSKMFFDEVFLLNDAEYNAFSNYQIEKYYTARAVLQQADNLESRKPNRDDSKNDDKPLDLFLPDDLPTKP